MMARIKAELIKQRLVHVAAKLLLVRLVPFSLVYVLLTAAMRQVQLWQRRAVVFVAKLRGDAAVEPRDTLIWVHQTIRRFPGDACHLCLNLEGDSANAGLHDIFSLALAFPRLRSIALYWNSEALNDDLPYWQGRRASADAGMTTAVGGFAVKGQPVMQIVQTEASEMALPVAVRRDAETYLKRRAGAAWAVCLNLPSFPVGVLNALASARPDVHFLDLSPINNADRLANYENLSGHGYTLHERMAFVAAADAYVGVFDELGYAALAFKRSALLLASKEVDAAVFAVQGETLWLPLGIDGAGLRAHALEFLSRSFPQQPNSGNRDELAG